MGKQQQYVLEIPAAVGERITRRARRGKRTPSEVAVEALPRYARERLIETKLRLVLAERARTAHAQAVSAYAAGPGSDRGADGYATDRDESESDQSNW